MAKPHFLTRLTLLLATASALGLLTTITALAAPTAKAKGSVSLRAPDQEAYGVRQLKAALQEAGWKVATSDRTADIRVQLEIAAPAALPGAEAYQLLHDRPSELVVRAGGASGLTYGALAVAEDLRNGVELGKIPARLETPHFPFRAIKFNLPWMSYRKGEALQLHQDTCRDLKFWEAFLDMMAENRFNALTLWGLHPYTLMLRPRNYPEACGLSEAELADWQRFWKALFRMARERGIETYLVNWNIFVSPEFAQAHNVAAYSVDWGYFGTGDTSDLVRRYTRECVTQVLEEYPDLTGLGITHGERMGGMSPQQRQQWIADTFIAGMKAARRPAKFIHRAPLSAGKDSGGSTSAQVEMLTRQALEQMDLPSPIWVELKFNWSHALSSPHLVQVHGGPLTDAYWNPLPQNYRITWMARNEDVFCLRWGEPDFLRLHLALNSGPYVGGYFVGSECYIPAKDYFHKPDPRIHWRYAFERQWFYYKTWGRLLYNPATPDTAFESEFRRRYGADGEPVFRALKLGSRMPLRLGSLYRSAWDFTLYAEGFLAPASSGGKFDATSPLISVEELMDHAALDPQYLSVKAFVEAQLAKRPIPEGQITPLVLADALERDAREALSLVAKVRTERNPVFFEVVDARAWAYLSLYFAEKLRGAVELSFFRRTGEPAHQAAAVARLTQAAGHWRQLVSLTEPVYREMPLIHLEQYPDHRFHWSRLLPAVERDIELARKP